MVKKETWIFILSEAIYFILLILAWMWFWILVDIPITNYKSWVIIFIIIFMIELSHIKREFEEWLK
jgi:hypothetical protein